jgi:hypothetical protein
MIYNVRSIATEPVPLPILVTTKPTRPDLELKAGCSGGNRATNRLKYGTARLRNTVMLVDYRMLLQSRQYFHLICVFLALHCEIDYIFHTQEIT